MRTRFEVVNDVLKIIHKEKNCPKINNNDSKYREFVWYASLDCINEYIEQEKLNEQDIKNFLKTNGVNGEKYNYKTIFREFVDDEILNLLNSMVNK